MRLGIKLPRELSKYLRHKHTKTSSSMYDVGTYKFLRLDFVVVVPFL